MNETKTGKSGAVHKTPTDLRAALSSGAKTQAAWKAMSIDTVLLSAVAICIEEHQRFATKSRAM